MTVLIYYVPARGIIVAFDDSEQSIFPLLRVLSGRKTSRRCSIDLSKHRSVTTDNPWEDSRGKPYWLVPCRPRIARFHPVLCHHFPQNCRSSVEKPHKEEEAGDSLSFWNYFARRSLPRLILPDEAE